MFFEDIKGHETLIDQFKEWLIKDQFEGIYLFHGQKGIGKYTVAYKLAKYLICSGVQDDTCQCDNCRFFPESSDFLLIKKENGIIKKSDIFDIDDFVSLLPSYGEKKVILVDNIEMLNKTAANQLLKNFEDVKDHVIILLVTSHLNRVLPTVLSRSTQISFSGLNSQEIMEILKAQGHKSKHLKSFKRAIPILSESILKNFDVYNRCVDSVHEFLYNFTRTPEDQLLSIVYLWEEQGILLYCLEIMLILLNDILRIHMDDDNVIFYSDDIERVDRTASVWGRDLCIVAVERLRTIIIHYKKGVNIKLYNRVVPLIGWLYELMRKNKQ